MKCLCLTSRIDRPSTKYRLLQYIPYFNQAGIDIEVVAVPRGLWRWKLFSQARDFDCVFIQKKLFSRLELKYLRQRAKKILYDFDDAVMYCPHSDIVPRRRYRRFRRLIKTADLIIAGNKYLASQVDAKYSSKLEIIPTVVDLSKYIPKNHEATAPKITLGWIGTKSNLNYLKIIEPALDKLTSRYPQLQINIVSDGRTDMQFKNIIHERWQENKESEQLNSFDIGLMPLPRDHWTEGKCGFKIIQYLATGLPVVCSPVGINTEIVKDNLNGFWADSLPEWEEKLITLIENKDLRHQFGTAGRTTIEKSYNLNHWGPYLAKLLSTALTK